MTTRHGVVTAGTWCVDINKLIEGWPAEEMSSEVFSVDRHGGGSACNFALDMRRLDPALPIDTIGVVGDDAEGHFLIGECAANRIGHRQLVPLAGETTHFADAYSVRGSGRRTHIYFQGVSDRLTPDHFDFSATDAKFLHLGLPGVHRRMDKPWPGHANGWVAVLAKAKAAGLICNFELLGIDSRRLAELALPCLPHLDLLVVNDREIGALAAVATVVDGETDVAAVIRAARDVFGRGAMRVVVVHFPKGAVAVTAQGEIVKGSVGIPSSEVVGANGAGDAFAAGFAYGFHEGWDIGRCVTLGHACAATSMRRISTSEGVQPWRTCLDLAEGWGWREL